MPDTYTYAYIYFMNGLKNETSVTRKRFDQSYELVTLLMKIFMKIDRFNYIALKFFLMSVNSLTLYLVQILSFKNEPLYTNEIVIDNISNSIWENR